MLFFFIKNNDYLLSFKIKLIIITVPVSLTFSKVINYLSLHFQNNKMIVPKDTTLIQICLFLA